MLGSCCFFASAISSRTFMTERKKDKRSQKMLYGAVARLLREMSLPTFLGTRYVTFFWMDTLHLQGGKELSIYFRLILFVSAPPPPVYVPIHSRRCTGEPLPFNVQVRLLTAPHEVPMSSRPSLCLYKNKRSKPIIHFASSSPTMTAV